MRRANRKQLRTKIGLRPFVFLAIVAIVLGAFAVSMNIKVEDRERAQRVHPTILRKSL
jgi:hypothetical protein